MSSPHALRATLVIVTAMVVQLAFVADLRIGTVTGDVMLLVAIAAGLEGGSQRGAAYGFAAGLVFDSLLQTPFGLSALVYGLVGFMVGSFQRSVLRAAWWIPIVTAFVASAAGVILYVAFGQLLGQQFRLPNLPSIVFVTAALNALLSPLAVKALHWAVPHERSPAGYLAR